LETFTKPRDFVENPKYLEDRKVFLSTIDFHTIDQPIMALVEKFAMLPYCFSLQSCYGHFLYSSEQDTHNLGRLPTRDVGLVTYRIAYMAFCLESSQFGIELFNALSRIPEIDPDFVQFGSADWFWERYLNSYVLQVEPARHINKDQFIVEHSEAQHIQRIRDLFFTRIAELLESQHGECRKG
jgi:hypothetical protein